MSQLIQSQQERAAWFNVGQIGERIVANELNRYDGYRVQKLEGKGVPDFKILIGGQCAGFAEVKVQKIRYVSVNDVTHLCCAVSCDKLDSYREYDRKAPLEIYFVNLYEKIVRWNYLREMELSANVGNAWFPLEKGAAYLQNGQLEHFWHINQVRYSFPISEENAKELIAAYDQAMQFKKSSAKDTVEMYRAKRMSTYVHTIPEIDDAPF